MPSQPPPWPRRILAILLGLVFAAFVTWRYWFAHELSLELSLLAMALLVYGSGAIKTKPDPAAAYKVVLPPPSLGAQAAALARSLLWLVLVGVGMLLGGAAIFGVVYLLLQIAILVLQIPGGWFPLAIAIVILAGVLVPLGMIFSWAHLLHLLKHPNGEAPESKN